MPAKSKAQYRYFQMMKHNPEKAEAAGISPKVADDFTQTYSKKLPGHVTAKDRANALKARQ